jgi:UDP-glucose 4-epimerase
MGCAGRGDPALVRILVTGAAGFINGYLVPELLEAGHDVIGIDDFSKYGPLTKSYDSHPRYRFVEGDAKNVELLQALAAECDQVVAAAAMIGGISYFHEFAYDLMAENERILASTFDAAIAAHGKGHLSRVIVVSSSMVYESATVFPTPEGAQLASPPPVSTYGFQKLAAEYFAKGAWEQYQLPYTIVRPFNCVGIGERRALRDTDIMSGNVKLALSHVVPDLALKVLKGQDPLHILGDGSQVRHYTYGGDLAHGIRLAMESPAAVNDDFNLSTAASTTVLELAECIWQKIHTDGRPFRHVSDAPFEHDVQLRVPDVRKARDILGFEATTSLDHMLDEVIPWIRSEAEAGRL